MLTNKLPFLFIVVVLFSFVFSIAEAQRRVPSNTHENQIPLLLSSSNELDTVPIRYIPADSIPKDTIHADTVRVDSVHSNAIDAPVVYFANDSIVTMMDGGNIIRLYGKANVKYRELELTGEYIEIDANKNMVYATFALDSIGEEFGYPIFKEGSSQYEMKKIWYNFKTKKAFIRDVITEQGEGYVTADQTKKMDNDDLCMINGRYTTCDEHDHPHFYMKLTKAKVRPKKNIVTGPAYLVLEDVPLPVFIPFGFFPFTSDYSSGIIMPTYGDEISRGFSLRDGGYYFAINDYMDLALTGEYYTKGSWGVSARSSYRKKYKFSGNLNATYLVTKLGDKGSSDYSVSKDFRLAWSHSKDPKADPNSTFTAGVNFSTSSYNKNSVESLSTPETYQNTKSSSVNYTRRFGDLFSVSGNATVNQVSKDTTLSMTLPNLTITMSDVYPFRRKEQVGNPRWYENIRMSYTGLFMNSISNVKEYDFLKKNIIKDWRNGMQHQIPVSASFNLFNFINISPQFSYTSRWYTNQIEQQYNYRTGQLAPTDTTYGFYRVWDYSGGISMNTKLYGFFNPLPALFGKWAEGKTIRHVMTPTITFNGAPDFSAPHYGYYKDVYYLDPATGRVDTATYSPYQYGIFSPPQPGQTGTMTFTLDNNIEMRSIGADTTRKYSLIDNLGLSMSYNFLADSMKWSNLNASLRLKLMKSFTLNLRGTFDTYTYDETGRRINVPRWEAGKGFGRLMATGTSFSYSLNNEVLKKLFGKKDEKAASGSSELNSENDSGSDNEEVTSEDAEGKKSTSLRERKKQDGEYDPDGYMIMNIPWNLSFSYSMSLGYDTRSGKFNPETREYPYRITQTLGISGNINPTKGWSFNFNTSYDFDYHKIAFMQCSITRSLHCWQMSASISPLGPYPFYSFTIAVNASLLKDLKYTQSSNYRDAVNWY